MHVFISLPVLSEPTCLLPSYVLSENMCSLLTLWHLRTYVFITSISFLKVRIHEAPCVISGHMSSLLFHCYFRTHVINIHSMIFQKQRVKYSMFFQNLRIHYSHYVFFSEHTRVQYFPWVYSELTFSLFTLHSFRKKVRVHLSPYVLSEPTFSLSSYVFSDHMHSLLPLCSFLAYVFSFRKIVFITLPMFCMNARVFSLYISFQNTRVHYSPYLFSEHTYLLLSICSLWTYVFFHSICSFRTYVFITVPIFFQNLRIYYSPHVLYERTCFFTPYVLLENMCSLLSLCYFRTYVFITPPSWTCVFITLPMLFPNIRVHYSPHLLSWPTFWLFFLCSF